MHTAKHLFKKIPLVFIILIIYMLTYECELIQVMINDNKSEEQKEIRRKSKNEPIANKGDGEGGNGDQDEEEMIKMRRKMMNIQKMMKKRKKWIDSFSVSVLSFSIMLMFK